MFPGIVSRLEDPNNPLLGPNLFALKIWGIWQTKPSKIKKFIHIIAVLFVLTQYVELWFIRTDHELVLRNLSITMLSTVCIFKVDTFIIWQKSWRQLVEFTSRVERHQISRKEKTIIANYTKYSRKITYLYWNLVTVTILTVLSAPLLTFLSSSAYRQEIKNGTSPYPEILSSWVPFDRTRGFKYWTATFEQSLILLYGAGVVASYDSTAFVLMAFLVGQLQILSENCKELFDDGNKVIRYDVAVKRIKKCYCHHLQLVRFSVILNSLLSPVMFLYVLICSLMICASAVQLTMESVSNVQRLWIAEYILALITQLFLFCWHGNQVLYMSLKVQNGVYASAWWSQNVRVRRSIQLLCGQLQKPIRFTAGPFMNLNVAAFISILKGSYSYYTLLSKKE